MSVVALLKELEQRKIRLWVEKGKLRFNAPKGAMTAEIKEKIKTQKARLIEILGSTRSSSEPGDATLHPIPRDGDLILSFAQQRLWLIDRLEPGNPAYNIPYAIRMQGPFDTALFGRALDKMIARHESLRTTFHEKDDQPIQLIGPPVSLDVPQIDLRPLPQAEREAGDPKTRRSGGTPPF